MELVRGQPITKYCDEQRLSTPERLELFAQVCQAVQHAHQKGIIHRDLKPSNILVMELHGRAVPKVIDFVVARATSQQLTEKTLFTRFGQMVGTPAYMSPEQAGLGGLDIDTRSDVYSLGVVLYELLTGRTPFQREELMSADGRLLATTEFWHRVIRLWDLEEGKELQPLQGHETMVWQVAFSPDGELLGSVSSDQRVLLWQIQSRRPLKRLNGHTSEVWSLAFAPDGQRLYTGSSRAIERVLCAVLSLRMAGHWLRAVPTAL